MIKKRLQILCFACIGLGLIGCGGSGGANVNDDGGDNIVNRAALTSPTPTHVEVATTAEPTPGSVTQGSNVQDGVTTDKVTISFVPDGTNSDTPYHPISTITTGDGRILKSNENPNRYQAILSSGKIVYLNRTPNGSFAEGNDPVLEGRDATYYPQYVAKLIGSFAPLGNYLVHPKEGRRIDDFWDTQLLSGSYTWTGTEEGSSDRKVSGELRGMSVFGFTDYPSSRASGDSDHLSWGAWIYYEYDATQPSPALDIGYGVFADGEETAFGDLPPSGTASYSGYSNGVALNLTGAPPASFGDDTSGNGHTFVAEVNLTADFSNANASIYGTVDNFKGYDNNSPSIIQEASDNGGFFEDLTITLDSATLEERDSHSFFTGNARATGLAGAEGKWGGQFFGTPGAGEAPPAAGGTWGVTQGENAGWKVLGGYGAWKTP